MVNTTSESLKQETSLFGGILAVEISCSVELSMTKFITSGPAFNMLNMYAIMILISSERKS